MKNIANLLFEAKMLKEIPRSGFHFLGSGKESIAEHTFSTTFIAYVMSHLEPDIDALKLISMCLVHDLPETEVKAVKDITNSLPFGSSIANLIDEFNEGNSPEAKLAYDADQLSLILELKALSDIGYAPPDKWLPPVLNRLKTETAKKIAHSILQTHRDEWWLNNYVDTD
jgi:putative hydrolase of HD superfamily